MRKLKPHQKKSLFGEALDKKSSASEMSDDFFVLSFRQLDRNQGDNWDSWEKQSMLAQALDTLTGYCQSSLRSTVDGKKFTIYDQFPPTEKTDFTHPKHVPEDAEWARIHVTGKQCLIGHVVKNTFYVVFLDGEHRFWKSELK